MKKFHLPLDVLSLLLITLLSTLLSPNLHAQAGLADDRVMLQGFYWESCRHGLAKYPQYGTKNWYQIVKSEGTAIRDARFDLIWLPPPCFAGDESAGYAPKEYFVLSNSYGSLDQQRSMLEELLSDGVEPVADIVVNHRDGVSNWTDFAKPSWGLWSICQNDECFTNVASPVCNTPLSERGAPEETPAYRSGGDYAYPSYRDLDHTNPAVRRDIIRYLFQLQSLGYRGWRYDMVHGYNAKWIAVYNRATHPTFSVGEYDWTQQAEQRGWVYATATDPGTSGDNHLRTCSSVFDFQTQSTLKDNKGNGHYGSLYGFGNGIGLTGDTTDGLDWCNRTVTFVENHDTGFRTNSDGSSEEGHSSDSFANGWEVEQAYAYILTHPGVPCVYWKHFFDWGDDLHSKIQALINARKVAGVNAASKVHQQENARKNGVYAAEVDGTHGSLYVRIGGDDSAWEPGMSGYSGFRDYAHGTGWKVWIALPGNPNFQRAPPKGALPIPIYKDAADIAVSDSLLN